MMLIGVKCFRFDNVKYGYICRSVVGKTPVSNKTGKPLLVVLQYVDKPLINTTSYFVYHKNPVVDDIFPLSHLLRYIRLSLSYCINIHRRDQSRLVVL